MSDSNSRFLVFGGTGAVGSATVSAALHRGWTVVPTARHVGEASGVKCAKIDPFEDGRFAETLAEHGPYHAVCWAQGANLNDNVFTFDQNRHLELYKANCLFVLVTLKALIERGLLTRPARLCVVSSIWQILARQDKLSYCVTKSALQGLVSSASTDLAAEGHLFNAVLPGALDTPMTKRLLRPEQINKLKSSTKFGSLPTLEHVTSVIMFLCSSENTGITGQFVAADLGMSRVHLL
jgi:NAD(P)-dependent dehydrogenase (short-subunit alcohol dehydrogenase family)